MVVVPPLTHREHGHRQIFCRADSPVTSYSKTFIFELCDGRTLEANKGEGTEYQMTTLFELNINKQPKFSNDLDLILTKFQQHFGAKK
jgi:hypothetical protein